MLRKPFLTFAIAVLPGALFAQEPVAFHSIPAPLAATAPTVVPALVPYSGASAGKSVAGERLITFLLFKDEQGGEPLWTESQTIPVGADGRFNAQLGASSPSGLPLTTFANGEPRWLEVQVGGETPQPRVLLMSVPYAMKSADAATLGGLPASAFVLASSSNAANAQTGATTSGTASTLNMPGSGGTTHPNTAKTLQPNVGGTTFPGSVTITGGNLILPATTSSGVGAVYLGSVPFLHGYAGNNKNVFVGGAGNFSTSSSFNAAVGYQALSSLSGGAGANTAVGDVALFGNTSGSDNTAVGNAALLGNATGTFNTAIGALSGPVGGSSFTETTAIGAGATVTQNNSLVLGQTSTTPGIKYVNVGVGTPAPRSMLELSQSARAALGPVLSLTNPAGQAYAAAAIDFNTSTPANGANYVPNAEIRAMDAGGYSDDLLFYSNKPGAINQGYQLNMEIAANGQVGIGAGTVAGQPQLTGQAQLVVYPTGSNSTAILAVGSPIVSGQNVGEGGDGVAGTGGNSTGAQGAGAGGSFFGGDNFENGGAGDGIVAEAGYGGASSGLAGFFFGDVVIDGNFDQSDSIGVSTNHAVSEVTIDHPLNPANQYLTMASVASPEMTTVTSGNVTTDESGIATVTLPGWFDAMHGDFRYQLTVVDGRFAQAIVSREIANHQFTISTNANHVKVSWQVTALRQDAYAKAHPLVVEQEKETKVKGFYKHPELFGQPEEKQVRWATHPDSMRKARERHARALAAYSRGPEAKESAAEPNSAMVVRER